GGIGYVLQPTFGYLLGFVLQAWFCGWAARRLERVTFRRLLFINLGGMGIVYALGLSYFYLISNYVIDAPVTLYWVILYCGILQVGPDIFLCVAAAAAAKRGLKAGIWVRPPKSAA
ncbi:MAG: biotin transporter BioY, partial [Negativicutes bacterium]